jgi:hypothetical protein
MTRRRVVLGVIAAACLVAVGRWETHHFEHSETRRIEALWQAQEGRRPTSYRLAAPIDCLGYPHGRDPFAVELCFDAMGRLVEAVDRSGQSSKLWSVTFVPSAAPVTVPPSRLLQLFHRMGALRKYDSASYLPTPQYDLGPVVAPYWKLSR